MSTSLLNFPGDVNELLNILATHEAALEMELLPLPANAAVGVASAGLSALVWHTAIMQSLAVSAEHRARFQALASASLGRLTALLYAKHGTAHARRAATISA